MRAPDFVIVGRIRRAHGIRGELVVEPITDEPAAVFAAGRRVFVGTADGEVGPDRAQLVVDATRSFKEGLLLVRFAGVTDRTAAQPWSDSYLLAPADELEPLKVGELYIHELPGMSVVLANGDDVGSVATVLELPQGYMLDVARMGGSMMVPLRAEFVVEIDRDSRRIVVSLPPGMLE